MALITFRIYMFFRCGGQCSCTLMLVADPVVVTGSGHTYERSFIANWLLEKDTDPETNEPLDDGGKVLVPNLAIKGLIDQHCLENGIEPPSVPDFTEDGSSGNDLAPNGTEIFTGPRGGRYYIDNGRRVYMSPR